MLIRKISASHSLQLIIAIIYYDVILKLLTCLAEFTISVNKHIESESLLIMLSSKTTQLLDVWLLSVYYELT